MDELEIRIQSLSAEHKAEFERIWQLKSFDDWPADLRERYEQLWQKPDGFWFNEIPNLVIDYVTGCLA